MIRLINPVDQRIFLEHDVQIAMSEAKEMQLGYVLDQNQIINLDGNVKMQ